MMGCVSGGVLQGTQPSTPRQRLPLTGNSPVQLAGGHVGERCVLWSALALERLAIRGIGLRLLGGAAFVQRQQQAQQALVPGELQGRCSSETEREGGPVSFSLSPLHWAPSRHLPRQQHPLDSHALQQPTLKVRLARGHQVPQRVRPAAQVHVDGVPPQGGLGDGRKALQLEKVLARVALRIG